MTDPDQSDIDAVERDRKRREQEMLWLLLLLMGQATRHAVMAQRMGHDPAQAARDVIGGNAGLELPGLAMPLSRLLATAYIDGKRRTDLLMGRRPPIEPITAADALAFAPNSQTIASGMADSLTGIIQDAVDSGRLAGLGTRAIASSIRAAVKRDGYLGDEARILKVVTERAVIDAHGAGMWQGWNEPDKWDAISGFIHKSVVDERTTKICLERADFARPKDDAYWRSNWPSLHFFCRSIIFPTWKPREWSQQYPETAPMPGFGRAPWLFGVAA